jgi:phage head maturation protease
MEPDFGGYATKAGLRCSDGRVIKAEAFQHMDGVKVPLVYQHGHSDMANVLGHALLESRNDGVYAYGYFNTSANGLIAKNAVQHGDIDSLSIYANGLREANKVVSHGSIREVSLVLSGANPGAKIDQVKIQHSSDPDDVTEIEDEAIIHSGDDLDLPPADEDEVEDDVVVHAEDDDRSIKDIYDNMSEEEKNVLHYMVGAALEEKNAGTTDAAHADSDEGLAHQEGSEDMTRNLFESNAGNGAAAAEGPSISHSDMQGILAQGFKLGSLKAAVDQYVDKANADTTLAARCHQHRDPVPGRQEHHRRAGAGQASYRVGGGVLAGTRHTPFSRIKTMVADLTQDEARAKGYIKGRYKLEEWFGVTKRTTTPDHGLQEAEARP